jgi:hypothetical protein
MAKKNTSQKFVKIDKDAIIALRKLVQAHLDPLMKDIGLEINIGPGTYGGSTGSLKLEFTLPAVDGIPIVFRENCECYGLTLEDFGKPFMYKNDQCKIIGLNTGARAFPIEVQRISTGKVSMFREELIHEALGKNVGKREQMIADLKALATKHPEVPLTVRFYLQNGGGFSHEELFGSFESFVKAAGLEDRLEPSAAAAAGK